MTSSLDAVQILKTPEVKTYLVNMFGLSQSGEQSYERLLEFFTLHSKLETEVALRSEDAGESGKSSGAVVSEAAKGIGIWDPERILKETESSIKKGLERFRRCQDKKDGSWGYHAGKSNAWATAHALLALNAARELGITSYSEEIEHGFSWMEKHVEKWSLADIPAKKSNSIYEASLAIRCFSENGRHHKSVDSSLERILRAQNPDGGWDTRIAGTGHVRKTEAGSEVGAASMALRALAASKKEEFQTALKDGLRWILDAQQPDGSWLTSGSAEFPLKERNMPSLAKTCDALAGIAAARGSAPEQDCGPAVSKALRWVFEKEKFLPDSAGWGYDQAPQPGLSPDLVSTCIVLEALVETEGVTLPQIATYAQLLMAAQLNKPESPEDGMWEKGDTFRTTLALIRYWIKIKASHAVTEPPNETLETAVGTV